MVRRSRLLKCLEVATDTFGGEPLTIELPYSAGLVTRITIRHGVCADQRETVLVLIDGMNRNLPAIDVMAEGALRSILATVNIRMTVLAIGRYVGKNRIDVALLAAHIAMHSKKRKAGLAVIELGLAANGAPRRDRVALLAGDHQRTMRALRLRGSSRFLLRECEGRHVKHEGREK